MCSSQIQCAIANSGIVIALLAIAGCGSGPPAGRATAIRENVLRVFEAELAASEVHAREDLVLRSMVLSRHIQRELVLLPHVMHVDCAVWQGGELGGSQPDGHDSNVLVFLSLRKDSDAENVAQMAVTRLIGRWQIAVNEVIKHSVSTRPGSQAAETQVLVLRGRLALP